MFEHPASYHALSSKRLNAIPAVRCLLWVLCAMGTIKFARSLQLWRSYWTGGGPFCGGGPHSQYWRATAYGWLMPPSSYLLSILLNKIAATLFIKA